jgi:hypothetical protein
MCTRQKKKGAYDRWSIFVVVPFSDIPKKIGEWTEIGVKSQPFTSPPQPEHPYVISAFGLPAIILQVLLIARHAN